MIRPKSAIKNPRVCRYVAARTLRSLHSAAFHLMLSSSGTWPGDPVNTDVGDGIEKPQRTGSPGQAG
jgi:hypothetical protein